MPIFEKLIEEHERIRDMFEKALSQPPKGQVFEQLKNELDAHMRGEEEYVYPETAGVGLRDQTLESIQEHHVARIVLSELQRISGEDKAWMPKLKVLHEEVEHHLDEEEEDLFFEGRKRLDENKQQEMADRYQQMRIAALVM